ncbi:unnamed protein product [Linum tenue]|uniref:Uncharacterized protein n=1 Tax=Linum tenue TaxID=586396 RepID=A0AAV0NNQ9_9ROSI|nr:unnamed protein product [Linum tenue]
MYLPIPLRLQILADSPLRSPIHPRDPLLPNSRRPAIPPSPNRRWRRCCPCPAEADPLLLALLRHPLPHLCRRRRRRRGYCALRPLQDAYSVVNFPFDHRRV